MSDSKQPIDLQKRLWNKHSFEQDGRKVMDVAGFVAAVNEANQIHEKEKMTPGLLCTCTDECLGVYHKNRKCRKS